MQPRDAASLVDILEAAKLLQSFLEGVGRMRSKPIYYASPP